MTKTDMDLKEFIKPELLILIPILYVVGIGLKKSKLSDTLIPLILGGIAIFMSTAWVIATSDISTLKDVAYVLFVSVTQGILSAGASVYVNECTFNQKRKIKSKTNKKGICYVTFHFNHCLRSDKRYLSLVDPYLA